MALTGELTLSGRILPVSGIREKVLAAQRAGVSVVVFPKANEVDINNLEDEVKAGLEIVLADANRTPDRPGAAEEDSGFLGEGAGAFS